MKASWTDTLLRAAAAFFGAVFLIVLSYDWETPHPMKGGLYTLVGVLLLAADKMPRHYADIYTPKALTVFGMLALGIGAVELIRAANETTPLPQYVTWAGLVFAVGYLCVMMAVLAWKALRMASRLLRRLASPCRFW